MPHWEGLYGVDGAGGILWQGFKDLEIKGQDNCARFPTVTLCLGAGLVDFGTK